VESLNLNIVNGIRVKLNALLLLDVISELSLLSSLNLEELLKNLLVICKLLEFLEVIEMCYPVIGTEQFRDKSAELRVTCSEPSSGCNAVCLIGELLRIDLIPVVKCLSLKDISMESCNTVNGMRTLNCEPCHLDLTVGQRAHSVDNV